ncbi:MAG TPA: cytochrome c [Burkholderiaceae bacterium]|jgi:mono/diheme cytochrome c family protein|nr:cytochrome c [Burkholderiaceae bacterium]
MRAALCALACAASAAHAQPDAVPSAARGKQLYTSFCARCHGIDMVNTGTSFDLRSFPRDQKERFVRSVTQGVRAMPAWGARFREDELDSLWLYVSSAP